MEILDLGDRVRTGKFSKSHSVYTGGRNFSEFHLYGRLLRYEEVSVRVYIGCCCSCECS